MEVEDACFLLLALGSVLGMTHQDPAHWEHHCLDRHVEHKIDEETEMLRLAESSVDRTFHFLWSFYTQCEVGRSIATQAAA